MRPLLALALLMPCTLPAQPAESNVIFGSYSGLALLMDVYKPASSNGYGIVVIPGMPLVDRGPYRWLRHPNYVAVVVEGIALPLVHTAWITAVAFTVLNAVLLRVRIRAEEDALSSASASIHERASAVGSPSPRA